MNKLTVFSLFFSFILFIFYILYGEPYWVQIVEILGINVGFTVDKNFSIYVFGFTVIIIALLGHNVIGFSDRSIDLFLEIVAYVGIWVLMSFYTLPALNSLWKFGSILYSVLTICYGVGCFLDIAQSGDENA